MPTQINLRRLLDRKQWEPCTPIPAGLGSYSYCVSSTLKDQYQYLVNSSSAVYQYDPYEDAWQTLPNPSLGGTFGAGSCGSRHPWGPTNQTATGGSTTTIQTALNLQRDLRGYQVRIVSGPNAGTVATIAGNTTGANAVITVTTPFTTAITSSSVYTLITGRLYAFNGGTLSTSSFKMYDLATNTWTALSVTGLPSTWGTDGRLIPTPGLFDDFALGTATGGTSTTLVNSAKNWGTNQWTNMQIRIATGTGAGQIRTVASNTSTTVTVTAAWATTPDSTSAYVIEGNSDHLYLMGNGATTLYRYSVTANTWTTLSPATARSGAPTIGMTGHWIYGIDDPVWSDESNYQNGRYIYSMRGNGSPTMDRYNIAANTWENDIAYAPKAENLTTGMGQAFNGGNIYLSLGNTGRFLKFNVVENRIEPWSYLWYAQGSALAGDRMFDCTYRDGATAISYIYFITHSQTMMFRCMIF